MSTMRLTLPIAMAVLGLGLHMPAIAQTSAPVPPPVAPLPAPCEAPEYHQLDFWIGRWDVYPTGAARLVAHSLIEPLYGGCAIRENWMPLKGTGGGSLSNYDRFSGHWVQAWVDSSGTRVDFTGGLADGAMVVAGFWHDVIGPGKSGLVRMRYSRLDDGAVRQLGEVSTDDGKSWQPSFDFTYKPAGQES